MSAMEEKQADVVIELNNPPACENCENDCAAARKVQKVKQVSIELQNKKCCDDNKCASDNIPEAPTLPSCDDEEKCELHCVPNDQKEEVQKLIQHSKAQRQRAKRKCPKLVWDQFDTSAYLMEFFGSMMLLFVIAFPKQPQYEVAAVVAVLLSLIYMGGHVSRAQYNCAVSIAFFLRQSFTVIDTLIFILVQVFGGIVGTLLAYALSPPGYVMNAPGIGQNFTLVQAFFAELFMSFVFVLIIMHVATAKKLEGNQIYAVAIASHVAVASITIGPVSGAVMNPVVATALMIVRAVILKDLSQLSLLWMYWVTSMLGAVFAMIAFFVTQPQERHQAVQVLKNGKRVLNTYFLK